MPLELEIIRAAEFVRVGPQGQFDLAASKAVLATLADACRKRGIDRAVMDLRALQPGPKPIFTPADLVELVRMFPEVGFDPQRLRLALLYRSDPHRRARLFSFLSALHGWRVRAFSEFEEALAWLSKGEAAAVSPRRPPRLEQAIPIRFRGQAASPALRAATRPRLSPRPSRTPSSAKRKPPSSAAAGTVRVPLRIESKPA